MAPEFVSFLQAVFFFIELVIYKRICNALIIDCLSNNQKWKALTTFYNGTVRQCYENDCKEMLSFYFLGLYLFFVKTGFNII